MSEEARLERQRERIVIVNDYFTLVSAILTRLGET